jgi:hypothetical protein
VISPRSACSRKIAPTCSSAASTVSTMITVPGPRPARRRVAAVAEFRRAPGRRSLRPRLRRAGPAARTTDRSA